MNGTRRQPPVYSPLSLAATWRALHAALRLADDPRPRAQALLEQRFGADTALLFGSGTQSLEVALRIARRLVGQPVPLAIPAYTCFDVATAAIGADLPIALYDIDPDTLAPDPTSLTAALRRGARIVVVAPLYGIPVNWATVEECVAEYDAVMIEDAAQGHGATWRNRPLGALGELSIVSFGRGKGWTGGSGGALLARGRAAALAAEVAVPAATGAAAELSVLGRVHAQHVLGRPWLYGVPASVPWLGLGETRYRAPVPVRSMTRAAAALVDITRSAADREACVRRENAAALLACLRSSPSVRPLGMCEDATPGYLRLPLRLARGFEAWLDAARAAQLGVARGYPSTLAALPAVQARLVAAEERYCGAETLVRELVTLPTHSLLTAGDRAQLVQLLERYPTRGYPPAHPAS